MSFNINGKIVEKTLLHYVPHGINSKIFHPIQSDDQILKKRKKEILGEKNYNFVLFYNSRNVQRKRTSNIILAYRAFCDNLSKEDAEKCILILHTEIRQDAGTDLLSVKEALCPKYDVMFSTSKYTPEDMNIMYNIADTTINISCLPSGTKISTKEKFINIEDIKIGDEVLTHKGRFRKVLNLFNGYNTNCNMVKITPFNFSNPIELTEDHKILCIKRKEMDNILMNENESIEKYIKWTEAKNIEKSDLVFYPIISNEELKYENVIFDLAEILSDDEKQKYTIDSNTIYYNSQNKINRFIKLDKDFSYLLGRWCGDGSNNTICFDKQYGMDEPNNIKKICDNYFGSDCIIEENIKKNCYILRITHSFTHLIQKLFKLSCGVDSYTKKIPEEILYNKNISILESFIKGLYDADGTRYKNTQKYPKHTITNISKNLECQLPYALLRLGKNIQLSKIDSGYKMGSIIKRFIWHDKNESGSNRTWFRDNYYSLSVRKVEKYKFTGMVYNFEVEDDNSYTTDSFVVKNSNEGFGLSTAESIMAGTPVIVAVTGGLQDQIGQTKDDGSPIEFDLHFGSNNVGKYKKHGEWAYPIWTKVRCIQGSIPTPYIFDDMTRWEDAAEGIMYWYVMGNDKREIAGLKGRQWALNEGGINSENMCSEFIKCMDYTLNNFKSVKSFEILTADDYVGNKMPVGMGFEIPKIDQEKLKQQQK